MDVLVIGAGGMIGRKLTDRLLAAGEIAGRPIDRLTLADVAAPAVPAGAGVAVESFACDLAVPGEAERLVERRHDLIVHLAAIVSGEAEADFERGYAVNLDGTRMLLEAIRAAGGGWRPRLVYTSSIAVFGPPFPGDGTLPIPDDFHTTPQTSYGTQKAIGELLLDDYSRRGFVDGVGIRLPTICVRPGKPNRAASGFFSGIVREPLAGLEAVLPVDDDVRHWFASPRAAVGFLLHAAALDTGLLGARRTLTMPGVSATVAEEIAALERIAGPKAVALIRREPDPTIRRIVSVWPSAFDARRALALGFAADADFDAIVRAHVDDERGGRLPF